MRLNDFTGKAVLISGGTKGIGLATGLTFARRGAQVWLTHRWGSADEDAIRARFAELGAPAPRIVEADASREEDMRAVLSAIKEQHDRVDVFISNVCVVMRGDGVEAHKKRSLLKSLDYSSWPFVGYLKGIHTTFGHWPRYAIATSSDGPDQHYPFYDYVAVAKAVLETFARYMATHLAEHDVKVNVVRTRQVITESYSQVFGEDNVALAKRFERFEVSLEEVSNTIYALCSGMMDGMSGQVLMVDRGASFIDNMMTLGPDLLKDTAKSSGAAQGEET